MKKGRKMISKPGMTLFAVSAMLFAAGCRPAGNGIQDPSPVLAKVDGIPITQERVDIIVKQRTDQQKPDTPEARKAIVENLTEQILASEEAVKKGLDKTPETGNQIDLARRGILASAFIQQFLDAHPVTDEQLKAEYEKYKAESAGLEYKARHIEVATEQEAKDLIAKLKKNPKAFETLAKEKTIDSGTKNVGGDLGWFDPQRMVPEFRDAVLKLEKGKVSPEPIKTRLGYHVVLLEDSRPKQIPSMEELKPMLTQRIQQQDIKKLFEDLKAKAKIEATSVSVQPTPAPEPKATSPAK
jgi:peptidyl-prolyl cis-trans isomerase C